MEMQKQRWSTVLKQIANSYQFPRPLQWQKIKLREPRQFYQGRRKKPKQKPTCLRTKAHTNLVGILLYCTLDIKPSNPLKEGAFHVDTLWSHNCPMVPQVLPKCSNLNSRINLNSSTKLIWNEGAKDPCQPKILRSRVIIAATASKILGQHSQCTPNGGWLLAQQELRTRVLYYAIWVTVFSIRPWY